MQSRGLRTFHFKGRANVVLLTRGSHILGLAQLSERRTTHGESGNGVDRSQGDQSGGSVLHGGGFSCAATKADLQGQRENVLLSWLGDGGGGVS